MHASKWVAQANPTQNLVLVTQTHTYTQRVSDLERRGGGEILAVRRAILGPHVQRQAHKHNHTPVDVPTCALVMRAVLWHLTAARTHVTLQGKHIPTKHITGKQTITYFIVKG